MDDIAQKICKRVAGYAWREIMAGRFEFEKEFEEMPDGSRVVVGSRLIVQRPLSDPPPRSELSEKSLPPHIERLVREYRSGRC